MDPLNYGLLRGYQQWWERDQAQKEDHEKEQIHPHPGHLYLSLSCWDPARRMLRTLLSQQTIIHISFLFGSLFSAPSVLSITQSYSANSAKYPKHPKVANILTVQ